MTTMVSAPNTAFAVYLALSQKAYLVPANKGILDVLPEAAAPCVSRCRGSRLELDI